MHALLLGFAALVIVLFMLHSFTSANTGRLARQIRLAVGALLMVIALALIVRGGAAYGLADCDLRPVVVAETSSLGRCHAIGARTDVAGAHEPSRNGVGPRVRHDAWARAQGCLRGPRIRQHGAGGAGVVVAGLPLRGSAIGPNSSRPISTASTPVGARTWRARSLKLAMAAT